MAKITLEKTILVIIVLLFKKFGAEPTNMTISKIKTLILL